MNIGLY
nr:unnamed protein product [Timema genevievae]